MDAGAQSGTARSRKKIREAEAQPDLHLINQPRDGKLYLISNLTPEDLSRRYLYWSWAHLLIFFVALGAFGWVLQAKPLMR